MPRTKSNTAVIMMVVTTFLVSPVVVSVVSGAWKLGTQYGELEENLGMLKKELEEEINTGLQTVRRGVDQLGADAKELEIRLNKAELKLKTMTDSFLEDSVVMSRAGILEVLAAPDKWIH